MDSVTTDSLWNVKKRCWLGYLFSIEYSSMTTLCLHVVTNNGNNGGRNIKESYNVFAKLSQGVENLNEVQTNPIKFIFFTLSCFQAVTAT